MRTLRAVATFAIQLTALGCGASPPHAASRGENIVLVPRDTTPRPSGTTSPVAPALIGQQFAHCPAETDDDQDVSLASLLASELPTCRTMYPCCSHGSAECEVRGVQVSLGVGSSVSCPSCGVLRHPIKIDVAREGLPLTAHHLRWALARFIVDSDGRRPAQEWARIEVNRLRLLAKSGSGEVLNSGSIMLTSYGAACGENDLRAPTQRTAAASVRNAQ